MIIHPDDHQKYFTAINSLLHEKEGISTIAYRIISKEGVVHFVESRCSIVEHDEFGTVSRLIGTVIDVTRQKNGEDEFHRLNRALLAISQCNQVLLRAQNEEELLHHICRIVVETGGYRMAWVGYAEHDEAKSIHPVAQAGIEEGYLETLMLSWDDIERGRGPTGTAIRTGQPSLINNLPGDSRFLPWREEAIKRGYSSNQSFPLKIGDKVFGALAIYSAMPNAFDVEETKLLMALADNMAYGIAMLRDHIERQQAEEALLDSERKFRTITEQIAEMVFVIDTSGIITYVSQAVDNIFGYKPHAVIGHLFTTYLVAEEVPAALGLFFNTLQDRLTDQIHEFRFIKKDGSVFFGEVHIHSYQDQGFSGMIGLIRDITERKLSESFRKQYERQLLENGQFLKSIYEEVNHSIFVVDVLSGGYYRYKGNNPLHELLTGIKSEELAGKSPEQLFDPPVAEAVIRNYDVCVHSGNSLQYEEYLPYKGKESWWETVLNPVRNESGQIFRIIGTSTNITERKMAEQKLLQLNKTLAERVAERTKELEITHQQMILQEKLASIGQLAAGIAHELNNPLNFIKINFASQTENFSDLLTLVNEYRDIIKKIEETDTIPSVELQKLHQMERELSLEQLLDDIGKIFAESQHGFERITTIINSMRSFSNRSVTNNKIPFDINTGIRDILILTGNEYHNCADIETTLEELPLVHCNPEQINQVFLNLIINSAYAIASQKRSSPGKISIHTWFDSSNVYCSITDDGPGIPDEIRKHIFEPFFSTKDPGRGKGRGLGLSISYDIITHKHQGALSVDCPIEGGTIFLITVPQQFNEAILDGRSEKQE